MKGSRIHGIVRELRNENIDIVNYTNNLSLYVQRSLTPAKINSIEFDEKQKASVYLKADQLSLAIGKGGANIKLASKLTGYEIDVFGIRKKVKWMMLIWMNSKMKSRSGSLTHSKTLDAIRLAAFLI